MPFTPNTPMYQSQMFPNRFIGSRAQSIDTSAFGIPNYERWQRELAAGKQAVANRKAPEDLGYLSDILKDQIEGRGPSVAENQLKQTTDENLRNQMALAASQRGNNNPGLAIRELSNLGATTQQASAGQAATLRAQETSAARQEMASVVDKQIGWQSLNDEMTKFYTGQGMALDLARQQASQAMQELLSANQNQFEATLAGIGNSIRAAKAQKYAAPWGILSDRTKKTEITKSGNSDAIRSFLGEVQRIGSYGTPTKGLAVEGLKAIGSALTKSGSPTAGGAFNTIGDIVASPKGYLLNQGIDFAKKASEVGPAVSSAARSSSVVPDFSPPPTAAVAPAAAAAPAAESAAVGASNVAKTAGEGEAAGGGASAAQIAAQYGSGVISGTKSTAANQQTVVPVEPTLRRTSVSPYAYQVPVENEGQIPNNQGAIGAIVSALASDVGLKTDISAVGEGAERIPAGQRYGIIPVQEAPQPEQKYTYGVLEQLSDERQKTNESTPEEAMKGFLDTLQAYKYKYKQPEVDGPGDHYGIMAQDLEKTPVGASMVIDTPRGKMVDYGKGFNVLLASMADMNKRVEKIEGRRK